MYFELNNTDYFVDLKNVTEEIHLHIPNGEGGDYKVPLTKAKFDPS